MKKLSGGLELVPGFKFAALPCGIRYKDRLDYTVIVADAPCNSAGLFTKNKVTAAPVKLCRQRIDEPIGAILINSTNANACTGDQGYDTAKRLTADMAEQLNLAPESVLMSSTGIIGHQLPYEIMAGAHKTLVENLSQEAGTEVPKAIMTTDTFPKSVAYSFSTGQGDFTIAGTAKGSGMIAPDMATLLSYVITDAPVDHAFLKESFGRAIDKSFNAITIDGDMSTNDTAIILAPQSETPLTDSRDLKAFEEALTAVALDLGTMLVKDGEGATKIIRIKVIGAASDEDARLVTKAITNSALVKTAFFGEDPNWGRIAMAAGYSGARVEEQSLTISFGSLTLLERGTPLNYDGDEMAAIMADRKSVV